MKKIIFVSSILFAIVSAFSCQSTKVIPEDATSTQLIQMGQDCLDTSDYAGAEKYFKTVIQRYGMDTSTYIEARYELGHLYLKQKNYEDAYAAFEEILGLFRDAEAGYLPASYKKLAQMGMNQIPDSKLTKLKD